MRCPNMSEFLIEFGIEPVEVDPSLAYCRYSVREDGSDLQMDFSFSAVMESFQIDLKIRSKEIMVISSEQADYIEFYREGESAGVRVVFDIAGIKSEAIALFEPEISCRWWTLRIA